jgi:hypothetical protein
MTSTTSAATPAAAKPLSEKGRKQRMSPLERAQANPQSIKLAVAAYCYNCQDLGTNTPHVTKACVRDCPAKDCALWPHRGWQAVTTRNADRANPESTIS